MINQKEFARRRRQLMRTVGEGSMVVLVGNGHIKEKFGVPDRAFALTQAPFRTIMPTYVSTIPARD